MTATPAKTISEELSEIGVTHTQSKFDGCRDLYTDRGDYIDSMDAHFAARLIACAHAAA